MPADSARKTAYALQQALVAQAITDVVPDEHHRRLVARGVFVALVNFTTAARHARKAIPSSKNNRAQLAEIKQKLNDLADRDWGPYAPLRDRIGAHRQPIGGQDDHEAREQAGRLWSEIDAPLVGVLCDDMTEIHAALHALGGTPALTPPTMSDEAAKAIVADAFFAKRPVGSVIDVGSFGDARENMVSAIQGGTVGERVRQLADTIDGFELHASLFQHMLGQLAFERFCRAGVLIETCNLVEIALDIPAGRRPQDRVDPLVDLVSSRLPEHADLATAKVNLPTAEVEWARGQRNTIAAHIDPDANLNVLLNHLDKMDLDRLQALWSFVDQALAAASNHPSSVLALLGIRGVEMQGLTRVDAPPYRTQYGS